MPLYQPAAPLTFANATTMLADGLRAIAGGQAVIDLAGVSAIDSSAVAVLLAWQRAARARASGSSELRFSSVPASLSNLAALYGVADLLHLTVPTAPVGSPLRADLPHH